MAAKFKVGDKARPVPKVYTILAAERRDVGGYIYKLSNGNWYFADEIEKISQKGGEK